MPILVKRPCISSLIPLHQYIVGIAVELCVKQLVLVEQYCFRQRTNLSL